MPYWQTYRGRNGSPHPYNQLINHDAAMQRVRGGPSRLYAHIMSAEEPLHLTRRDEVTGCRWEPGELPHEGHDPQHCPYSIREEKRGVAGDAAGLEEGLAGEGEWENDGRDEWEKLVLRPTEKGGEERKDGFENPHPGTKRGESLVNEVYEDRLIRHAQGKSVRVLGLEDDKLRSAHDVVIDPIARGDNSGNHGEESSSTLRPPFENCRNNSGKNNVREERGLEKFMTKIKEGLKTPSPSSRPGTPSQYDGNQQGLIEAKTKIHEGHSPPTQLERHRLSSSPEALTIMGEDEKRRPQKRKETPLLTHDFNSHDYEDPKRSGKSMKSLRAALASTPPPPQHHARPENHHHHKQPGEESGFGKVISKIKEGFEHSLMGRETVGIIDPRFWEKREELDHLRRTAKRDEKAMKEVKKEGEG